MSHYAHSLRNAPRERWHLLAEHLEDTGARAAAIAAKWGAEIWGHAVGRLHDIGKFAPDGLRDAAGAQLAMGLAPAILTPLVAAFMEGAPRWFAVVVFVVMLACVIVVSGSRVGGAIDRAEGQREAASRATKVAKESEQELKELLGEARATKKTVCARRTIERHLIFGLGEPTKR